LDAPNLLLALSRLNASLHFNMKMQARIIQSEESKMSLQKLLLTILSLACLAQARAADFTIDQAHSSVSFRVKHLGISTVTGHFDKFLGTVSFDAKDLQTLKANAAVQVASVNTGVEKRDTHLRGADFFDATKYPQMAFAGKSVKNVKGDKFELVGDLTLHGVTKPVTLECEFGGVANSPFGDVRAGFSATATVNREDFGITGGGAGAMVGKEIKINLEIECVQKK
jgi:polyisoprenoid-binding protein YceI